MIVTMEVKQKHSKIAKIYKVHMTTAVFLAHTCLKSRNPGSWCTPRRNIVLGHIDLMLIEDLGICTDAGELWCG